MIYIDIKNKEVDKSLQHTKLSSRKTYLHDTLAS